MRVLILSNLFPPEFIGGYELVAYELAEYLSERGHEVAVATSRLINGKRLGAPPRYRVFRTMDYTGLRLNATGENNDFERLYINIDNAFELSNIIEEFTPDRVLLCNIDGLGALGVITLLYYMGMSTSIYLGDNFFGTNGVDIGLRETFYRLFGADKALRSLNAFIVGYGVRDEIEKCSGVRFEKMQYVPGWVSDRLPEIIEFKEEDRTRFIFSSRIAPHKGIDVLLDAVRHLVKLGDDNFEVHMYGGGHTPQFMQKVHSEGMSNQIYYLGVLDRQQMVDRFRTYDALVFPTWEREPLGLVPFEAAAQGCIPIMTAQSGAAEWLTSMEAIKINRNAEELAGGMQRVMYMSEHDKHSFRKFMSKNVRTMFSARRWCEQIERSLEAHQGQSSRVPAQVARNAIFAITRAWRG
jgi:glycosyltransferase involved in cell wall biosynthesis